MAAWHLLSVDEVLQKLASDRRQGLTDEEAQRRLAEHGPNELIEKRAKSVWKILWEQLTAILVLALIVAATVSALLGDIEDAVAILAIVIINTVIGVRQEYQAEQAMAALKKLAVPQVRVRRGGRIREVPSREIVPGDIVLLEAGSAAPADGRLLEAANLRVEEAALTGESQPAEKDAEAEFEEDPPVGDRVNSIFMGTNAVYGRGVAVVTATGMDTELGRIADLLQDVEDEATPLQKRLDQLGRVLILAALAIVAVVFGLGVLRGEELRLMFLTAVSLAVAAVPEGLPAVVTIALSLGSQRMLKRNALIRRLPAVETLGSVTVICTDKTGTLTENRMTVRVLRTIDAEQSLEDADGVELLLAAGALCNDASLEEDDEGDLSSVGDPTEGALVLAAAEKDLRKPDLDEAFERVGEAPFDSDRKRMSTLHSLPADGAFASVRQALPENEPVERLICAKGAMDSLLPVCAEALVDGQVQRLDEDLRRRIVDQHDALAEKGMRILAVAVKPLAEPPPETTAETLERDLIYLGLVGMIDPPRSEVREAVAVCKNAGIRPVMITGDHPKTAKAIAKELGIGVDEELLTGRDLDGLSERELRSQVKRVGVYARVSPEHKLKIVDALQDNGHIVAMTGDGVNDAPALKKGDIGVAMGVTGTDVSKEASDMVLRDDNFATIVAAIEEGRIIFDNIRKFIRFLLSANSAELWVMLAGPLLGMPLPLLPLQILWMNLITDGPPALALGVEKAELNTMKRPPHEPGESVFSRGLGRDILWSGFLMGALSLSLGWWYWSRDLEQWQTMVFTTLTLSQMALAFGVRSEKDSLFRIGAASNPALLWAVGLSVALQIAVVYLAPLQGLFDTVSLSAGDLAVSLAASTAVFWAVEIEKALRRRSSRADVATSA